MKKKLDEIHKFQQSCPSFFAPRTRLVFFAFAFLLFSISFASLIWTLSVGISAQKINPVTSKPVLLEDNLIFVSQEGYVYSVSPASGDSLWSRAAGSGYPRQPVIFGDTVVVGSSSGNVIAFKNNGMQKWNVSIDAYLYGLTAADKVYVTTQKGVFSIDKAGNVDLFYNASNATTYTSPASDGKRVVFGMDNKLVSIKLNRQVEWVKEVASFWKSDPVIDSNMVFIGALDNHMYAFDANDGFFRWKIGTNGWVMSTPYVSSGNVYFGSNDGYIYSVEEAMGTLRWKVATKEAVQSTPVVGFLGGKTVVFAGSNDNNLYAVDDQTGEMLWKQPTKGWVHSPIVIGRAVIFGAHDGKIYSVSTERACTIESPEQDSVVGYKEVPVKGKAFSEYGDPKVYLRVNEGGWEEVQVTNGTWKYILNPVSYDFGIIQIECRITDSLGQETAPYTGLSVVRSQAVPKEKMNVIFPASVQEGREFNVTVLDEDGKPVLNFEATFQGKTYKGSGQVTLKALGGGKAQVLKVTKPGFEAVSLNVDVSTATEWVWAAIGAVLVFILIAFVYYKRIMRK